MLMKTTTRRKGARRDRGIATTIATTNDVDGHNDDGDDVDDDENNE